MWWDVATLTTVDYGDMTSITNGRKIFGACITIVGIGMVALPAGILASGFSDHLRGCQDDYEDLVDATLEDGIVTRQEQKALEANRQRLGLSKGHRPDLCQGGKRDSRQASCLSPLPSSVARTRLARVDDG